MPEIAAEDTMPKDTATMPAYEISTPVQAGHARIEGVTVIGEAVRRVSPESAEFLIEIATSAPTAAQALRDNQAKTAQLAQTLTALGLQQADLQTISMNVYNVYAPALPALPGYGPIPQLGQGGYGQGGYSAFGAAGPMQASPALSNEVQFGSYQAHNTVRVNVRDPGRVGEIVDAAIRAGGILAGGFSFKVSDEAHARRAALEAAGKDARAKAETLASAAGKQIGDPVALSEDIVVSNGAYAALRMAVPFAFGAGAPRVAGELEYYARVSANFRLQ
jgi:hypothetical protein